MNQESKLDRQLESEFSADMLDLKSKLKSITSEKQEAKKTNILRLIIPIIAIAAGLALAIMFLPSLFQDGSSEGLYAANYEPYPMALNQRGDGDAELNEAIAAYSEANYAEASLVFSRLFAKSNDAVHLLYQASSQQAMGEYNEAVETYDNVIALNDSKVTEQAQWYKALALIKIERSDEAMDLLKSFGDSHYKFEDAQKLLK